LLAAAFTGAPLVISGAASPLSLAFLILAVIDWHLA
jgi:hypothetical protein